MSSIDFHEDEWGRHWSQAPGLHRTAPKRSRWHLASVPGWIVAKLQAARRRWLEERDRQALERMSPEALRDIFPEDHVLPVRRNALESVRDAFGRAVV